MSRFSPGDQVGPGQQRVPVGRGRALERHAVAEQADRDRRVKGIGGAELPEQEGAVSGVGPAEAGAAIAPNLADPSDIRIQRDVGITIGSTSDLTAAFDYLLESVCQIDGIDCGGVYWVDYRNCLIRNIIILIALRNRAVFISIKQDIFCSR